MHGHMGTGFGFGFGFGYGFGIGIDIGFGFGFWHYRLEIGLHRVGNDVQVRCGRGRGRRCCFSLFRIAMSAGKLLPDSNGVQHVALRPGSPQIFGTCHTI